MLSVVDEMIVPALCPERAGWGRVHSRLYVPLIYTAHAATNTVTTGCQHGLFYTQNSIIKQHCSTWVILSFYVKRGRWVPSIIFRIVCGCRIIVIIFL